MTVNPALGTWDDITAINSDFNLMADLVINHVSSAHPWFKNYLQNISPGKDYFIEFEKEADYRIVIRPRSSALFTKFETSSGEKEVWTTFSPDQIDLNFSNPEVLIEMIRILVFYISMGVRFIRLDAIAFLWKCSGTCCLHLDETHEIVKLMRDVTTFIRPGTVIITETNVPNRENWSYFGRGDEAHMVYQFSLPPLLLHALFSGNSAFLNSWAYEIPETEPDQTFLNYTASHDGIGVRPLEGLLPENEITTLIDGMKKAGGMISMRAGKDGVLGPYEINITWFDAMRLTAGGADSLNEARYICSQSIMMSMKGIPAFYIHSLVATPNDHKGVEITGRARSINRKELNNIDLNRILEEDTAQRRIYEELTRLIKLRRDCAAFHPQARQDIISKGNNIFAFTRSNSHAGLTVHCISNITGFKIIVPDIIKMNKKGYDLIADEWLSPSDPIVLKPYQTCWIKEME
jgi:sucrose phosphorylase